MQISPRLSSREIELGQHCERPGQRTPAHVMRSGTSNTHPACVTASRAVDGREPLRASYATSVSLDAVFGVGVGATVGEEHSLAACDESNDVRDVDVCDEHPDTDDAELGVGRTLPFSE